MPDKEIIEKLENLIKEVIKGVIERLALEERSLYLYTTNQLERLIKEVKRRTKVIEVFCEPGALYKVVYLVLRGLEERYRSRKLRGFEEFAEEGLLSCGHS